MKRWISARSVTVATTDDAEDVAAGGAGAAGIAADGGMRADATAKDQRLIPLGGRLRNQSGAFFSLHIFAQPPARVSLSRLTYPSAQKGRSLKPPSLKVAYSFEASPVGVLSLERAKRNTSRSAS